MPKLTYPVILSPDIQIVTRTDDAFYVIKYRNAEGGNSIIWLPDTLILQTRIDSTAGRAIEMVKDYLAEQVRIQHPYLGFTDSD